MKETPLPAYNVLTGPLSQETEPKLTVVSLPAVSLPTYDQSEKFTKDGVLPVDLETSLEGDEDTEAPSQGQEFPCSGCSLGDFAIFFIGALFFSQSNHNFMSIMP